MVMSVMWQAQQALEWGLMRSFWCYGSERFWNFCGHMIKDRAHPLANFINAFNLRRSVDEVPPPWIEEVISYATQHDIKHIKSAVEHMQSKVPEPVHGLRALYLRSVKNQKPASAFDTSVLRFVLPQLDPRLARDGYDFRTTSLCLCRCDPCGMVPLCDHCVTIVVDYHYGPVVVHLHLL